MHMRAATGLLLRALNSVSHKIKNNYTAAPEIRGALIMVAARGIRINAGNPGTTKTIVIPEPALLTSHCQPFSLSPWHYYIFCPRTHAVLAWHQGQRRRWRKVRGKGAERMVACHLPMTYPSLVQSAESLNWIVRIGLETLDQGFTGGYYDQNQEELEW
eukprot:1142014-Pelagomonas_calceolata.AAC.3